MLGFMKRAAGAVATQAKVELGSNADIMEAYAAVGALVATAGDGDASDTERNKIVRLILNVKELAGLFQQSQVESILNEYIRKAQDAVGRQDLVGELEDMKKIPNSDLTRKKLYLFAKDVAGSEGGIDEAEQKRIDIIASLLGVETSGFAFD
jgi:tellurite resistance protein